MTCFTVSSHRGNLRPRNPWAAIGSVAFHLLLLLVLIVIPLFRTDPLPKRETLTMLYLQPPSAAAAILQSFERLSSRPHTSQQALHYGTST